MKKIAWITDSTCGLPEDYIETHHIHVVPLSVIINGVPYRDDIDMTKDEFYDKLRTAEVEVKSSQASLGDFFELYKTLKKKYDCGIAIHASGELSGTFNNSVTAAEQTGFPVKVIDSKIGNYALGKMIRNGLELEAKGKSYKKIVSRMKEYPELAEMYLLPASLEQLRKSGRVRTSQAVFASLLRINLLLRFNDGSVVVEESNSYGKKGEAALI